MATLTMATAFGQGSISANLIDAWAAQISVLSGGTHSVAVFHNGVLVNSSEVQDAVEAGVVDMGWYSPFQFPDAAALTLGPDIQAGPESSAALFNAFPLADYSAIGVDLLAAAYLQPYVLASNISGTALGSFFPGSKIGVNAPGSLLLSDLGASSVAIPVFELFTALSVGILDGILRSPDFIVGLSLNDVVDNILTFPEPGGLYTPYNALIINSDTFDGLPSDFQDLTLATTGADFSAALGAAYLADYLQQLQTISDEGGTTINELSGSDLEAWNDALDTSLSNVLAGVDPAYLTARDSIIQSSNQDPQFIDGISTPTADEWDTGPWALVIPTNLGINDQISELDGATIALPTGSDLEAGLSTVFQNLAISYEPVPVASFQEATQQFLGGAADVLVVPVSNIDEPSLPADLLVLPQGFNASGEVVSLAASLDELIVGDDTSELLQGNAGNDTLRGLGGEDTLEGGDDDDRLEGGQGSDSLDGGDQNDELFGGGSGEDTLIGGRGSDFLFGENGDDLLEGGDGFDLLNGGTDDDTLIGGNGNDRLLGNLGNDSLEGDAGNDTLFGGPSGNDILKGGDNDDQLFGETGKDILFGDDGNDTLNGGSNDDTLLGGNGDDSLEGGSGNDQLFGGPTGADTLKGGQGSDFLFAESADDVLEGGDGFDLMNGGAGDDVMRGGNGGDQMIGNLGNDVIEGDAGDDNIFGSAGNDTISGGTGNDTLRGELGADTFIFEDGFGTDEIIGFQLTGGDVIDLALVTSITGFADLQTNHLSQDGADAVITDGVNTIRLVGIDENDLLAGDFDFGV